MTIAHPPVSIRQSAPARSGFAAKVARRLRRYCSREKFLVYRVDLKNATSVPAPELPVRFSVDPTAVGHILASPEEYDIEPHHIPYFQRWLAAGEICFSAWVDSKVVFFGWAQFTARQPCGSSSIPIPEGTAWIYRCFTHPDYRGHRIYPAALSFMLTELSHAGRVVAYIDHAIDNVASQRGITRLGAQVIGHYCINRFAAWRWLTVDDSLSGVIRKDDCQLS